MVEINVVMPKLGLTMRSGTIVEWLKKEGDMVRKDEALATIETGKISGEIRSPDDGVLKKILRKSGEEVPVGEIVAVIEKE
ncbi:MAG: biotin/lipoyl-containing protein [Fervidicoccaceae archaeon]